MQLIDLEIYAQMNNIPIIKKEGIEFICDIIQKNNIKKILEIGTAIGYSSICMALVSENINVTTIERDMNRYNISLINIKEFNLDKRIRVINADALDIELTDTFDLIFVDGAKGKYISFFEKYSELLNENGIIITDNISFHGLVENDDLIKTKNQAKIAGKIRDYKIFLNNNSEFYTTYYNVGDGIAVTIKKNIR